MPEPQPTKQEKTQVVPEEVFKAVEGASGIVVRGLTPTQRAGMQLAIGVGLTSAVVIALVGLDWVLHTPRPPVLPTDPTAYESIAKLIEDYKTLSDLALERATKMFDLVVVKVLLPVFTTILGYIFGSRPENGDDTSG